MWHLENVVTNITASVKFHGAEGKLFFQVQNFCLHFTKVSSFLLLMFFNDSSRDGAERMKVLP